MACVSPDQPLFDEIFQGRAQCRAAQSQVIGQRGVFRTRVFMELSNDGDIMTIEDMVSLLTFYDQDDNSLMFYQMLSVDEPS